MSRRLRSRSVQPGDPYALQFFKHPKTPHWRLETLWLGEDEHGTWLVGPVGNTLQKGSLPPEIMEVRSVHLVKTDAWWLASYHPTHAEVEFFIDAVRPAQLEPQRAVAVDLDLDVLRLRDGTVLIDDQDEFEDHRIELGYPDEWVQAVRKAMAWVTDSVANGVEPFGTVSRLWWERAAPFSP